MRTKDSHVLLLSPQIELSPLYYHYLIYHLLEYKYSTHGSVIKTSPNLMGISLELPTHLLNDSEPLVPPLTEPSTRKRRKWEPTPFLWQAPNSNAALYFGDKWMEFHSFLTARLSKPPTTRTKLISKSHPSWLEFLLELMSARRYSLLYPGFSVDDQAIATVHDELYQAPEEFSRELFTPPPVPELNPDEPLSLVYEKRRPPPNTEHSLLSSTLLSTLPNSGNLPEIPDLPLLAVDGYTLTQKEANDDAWTFTEAYRRDIGGCEPGAEISKREPNSALDLFCHLDQVYDPLNAQKYGYTNKIHHVQPYHDRPPVDEDVIPTEQKESAKKEASEHLARQAGKAITASPPKEKSDSSKETQNEFKAQLERQKKQVESAEEKRAEGPGEKEKEKEKEREKENEKEANEPLPTQGSKNQADDPKPTAAQEKGAGW